MYCALANLAHQFHHFMRIDAPVQPARAVDVRVHHRPARIRLESQRLHQPALAEAVEQRTVVAVARVRKPVEQAVRALEYSAWTREARARQHR
jgi:hypothetical protein